MELRAGFGYAGELEIDGLVVIGRRIVMCGPELSRRHQGDGHSGTIDNDLAYTDYSIGSDTAEHRLLP